MDKLKAMLEVLKGGVKREAASFRYYYNASIKSEIPEAKSLLMYLAEEERKHKILLLKEYQTFRQMLSKKGGILTKESEFKYRLPKDYTFKRLRTVRGIDIAGISLPIETISGDFLDSFPLVQSENKRFLAFILYDVMGHGLSASNIKSVTRAIFQKSRLSSRAEVELFNPRKVMNELNQNIFKECQKVGCFVTVFYCLVDLFKQEISYSSAGHEPPVLLSPGSRNIRYLSETELLAGIDRDIVYTENRVKIHSGDTLVIFTDGIIEAVNSKEKRFGRNRLVRSVVKNIKKSSDEIIKQLLDDLRKFIGKKMLIDDLSIAVIKID